MYLEDEDVPRKIETIHAAMDEYTQSVLTRAVDGFIYVERTEGRPAGGQPRNAPQHDAGRRPGLHPHRAHW